MICACGKEAVGREDYGVWFLGEDRKTDPRDQYACCRLSRHRDYMDRVTYEYRVVAKPNQMAVLYGIYSVTRWDGQLLPGYRITDARGEKHRVTPGGIDFLNELKEDVQRCQEALTKPVLKATYRDGAWVLVEGETT